MPAFAHSFPMNKNKKLLKMIRRDCKVNSKTLNTKVNVDVRQTDGHMDNIIKLARIALQSGQQKIV